MFKAFRVLTEKVAAPTGVDADDKKRLTELAGAVAALQRSLAHFLRATVEASAAAASLHLELANVYPAGDALSAAVVALNTGDALKEAPVMAREVNASLGAAIEAVRARIAALTAQVDERQILRAEIAHYRDKVTRLANEGLTNDAKQSKAESNQEK